MPFLSLSSPIGDLTVFEEDGRLVALDWGRVEGQSETPLLLEARRQLEAYFDGEQHAFTLPLSPQGTAFQRRVWDAMCQIPYGEAASYGAIARRLGSSPRAVGTACGKNPLPILIPCHRIVSGDGSLGGYSGQDGVATKQFLLTLEGWPKG